MEDNLVRIANLLSDDMVRVHNNPSTYKGTTRYSDTMKRVSIEMYCRYKVTFDIMVRVYRPGKFTTIAEYVFPDDKINWGRIIALYTLCGLLAKKHENEQLPQCLGNFFERRLVDWVRNVGGFENFLKEFPKPKRRAAPLFLSPLSHDFMLEVLNSLETRILEIKRLHKFFNFLGVVWIIFIFILIVFRVWS